MNESQSSRIWRPVVEATNQTLPYPGSADQQQVYTETSLRKSGEISFRGATSATSIQNLNKDILSASEAFNNSPKPFCRPNETARSTCGSSSLAGSSLVRNPASGNSSLRQQDQEFSTVRHQVSTQSQGDQAAQAPPTTEEDDMALKLVHKQYNSPIDLYSMNNIRKTIEAHTELIAPGVKGINFMKPDTPVNKQSEVYKLVMEEENQRMRGQSGASATPPRLSPISGQPLNLPRAYLESQEATEVKYATQHQQQVNQSALRGVASSVQQRQASSSHHEQSEQQQVGAAGRPPPVCCECGQFIVGPFAKIQNRCVHAHCFNCSTCGTSLKNTGYFTVNEKLYCDIHAKQVANMMHIKYDFGERQQLQREQRQQQQQQQIQQQLSLSSNSRTSQSEMQQSSVRQTQETHLQPLTATTMSSSKQTYSSSTSPATISTMFADRSQSQTTGSVGGDTSWSWRPATGSELQQSVATTGSTSSANLATKASNYYNQEESIYSSHRQQQQQQHSPTPTNNGSSLLELRQQQQQQQQVVSMGTRGRGLLQDSSALGAGRLPVCTHCRVQIHGPYILAGRTTWCKHCSQVNFNCSSCKRSLLDTGFIQDNSHKYYCEHCFEAYFAPVCSKCNIRIKGDCLNALGKQWHPSCFVCGHCRRPFGNSSFYLEDNVPYCERDWSVLFTTKCYNCSYPIQAGDKWIEALERNYHANCFRCSSCKTNLEGSTFYSKNGKPYCRLHAR